MESMEERLRRVTRPVHDRLEKRLDWMEDGFSEADYLRVLSQFLVLQRSLESAIMRHPEWNHPALELSRRRNSRWIVSDLRDWEATPAENTPDCFDDLECFEDLLGALYVLEGSTHGGVILVRHFQRKFGPERRTGFSYFEGYGSRTGVMWRRLLAAFERLDREGAVHSDRVVAAAIRAYSIIERQLLSPG